LLAPKFCITVLLPTTEPYTKLPAYLCGPVDSKKKKLISGIPGAKARKQQKEKPPTSPQTPSAQFTGIQKSKYIAYGATQT